MVGRNRLATCIQIPCQSARTRPARSLSNVAKLEIAHQIKGYSIKISIHVAELGRHQSFLLRIFLPWTPFEGESDTFSFNGVECALVQCVAQTTLGSATADPAAFYGSVIDRHGHVHVRLEVPRTVVTSEVRLGVGKAHTRQHVRHGHGEMGKGSSGHAGFCNLEADLGQPPTGAQRARAERMRP
jgi:hypothetical protein